MTANKNPFVKRCIMMVTGILFIGICVGAFRLSAFGVDAFTCMNLGISGFLGMQFGTWQLIMNTAILIVVFFTARECIGAGTIVNMVCVGYMADFICWIVQDQLQIAMTLPLRIGIAPYDSVAIMIEKQTKGRIAFQAARVMSDVTVVVIGVAFCLLARGNLWLIIGIGTICNALFNGPVIQFFKTHLAEPLMNGK